MKLTEEQLKNKELTKEYPWLIPRNRFTGEIVEDYDYSWTELDAMPKGWKEAFALKLCNELKNALGKK